MEKMWVIYEDRQVPTHSVTQFYASSYTSFKVIEPWRVTCYQKNKENEALRGTLSHKQENLWMPHHHRGFSPLGSHRTVSGKSE